jgi:hypothetical protein
MSQDLKKVVCLNLDQRFKHHRKLQLGKVYLSHDTSQSDSIAIYDNQNGKFLGFFKSENFESIEDNRDRKLSDVL